MKEKLSLQRQELLTKQKALKTFNKVEGKNHEGKRIYECPKCKGKCFVNRSYLQSHIIRRHKNEAIKEKKHTKNHADPQLTQINNAQAEELKVMQRNLEMLLTRANVTMMAGTKAMENAEAHDIDVIKNNLDEIKDKYRRLQLQYSNLENTQKCESKKTVNIMNKQRLESPYREPKILSIAPNYESIFY